VYEVVCVARAILGDKTRPRIEHLKSKDRKEKNREEEEDKLSAEVGNIFFLFFLSFSLPFYFNLF
jgi:hypothetical protein